MKVGDILKEIQTYIPEISELNYIKVKYFLIEESLLNFEKNFINNGYKFGILYCSDGQTDENHMYANGPSFLSSFLN